MLEFRTDVRATTQVNVLPQVVARASLLELDQDELEARVLLEVDRNPALELAEGSRILSGGAPALGGSDDSDSFARIPAAVTIGDDLRWQLHAVCRGDIRRIAEYVLENLDSRGYLATPVFDLADELGVDEWRVESALRVVQSLEPAGVGARNLAECLKLQVLARPDPPAPPGLLEFLETEFTQIVHSGNARSLRSPAMRGARRFLAYIREHMHPYPADLFRPPFPSEEHRLPTHAPDVVVSCSLDSLVVAVPMSERLVLRIEAAYENLSRMLSARKCSEDEANVRRLVSDAREFISNLTHRHTVMAQVAAAVIEEQSGYLQHGPRGLRSLTKKELAEKLRLHESTICRATRGKTVMLPDGETVPFGVFFEDALPAKVCLAQIIRREDSARPYTDTELVDELAAHNYHVARRTVSKYRACVGIAPAPERKVR